MPFADRSSSNCSLLTKSRRTGSWRSFFQSRRTAPLMWFLSYAAVSSSTSTSTVLLSSSFDSTQSASTSAVALLIPGPPWKPERSEDFQGEDSCVNLRTGGCGGPRVRDRACDGVAATEQQVGLAAE